MIKFDRKKLEFYLIFIVILMEVTMEKNEKNDNQSWLLRFVKGMFVGSGFIVPGVSGGALAAIFGIYERIINFLANITKNFKENIRFFLPVGIGALVGIAILSWGISYLLGSFEVIITWFFIGAIVGTAPALWAEAGKEGRDRKDYIIIDHRFCFRYYSTWFWDSAIQWCGSTKFYCLDGLWCFNCFGNLNPRNEPIKLYSIYGIISSNGRRI